MSPLQFKFFSALTLIYVVLMFGHHSVKADFSDICVNSTNSTSCSRTYEHVYNSLAKSENSLRIGSALYPAKKPSSVRVFVNVYGPNKTRDSAPVAKYTWSISCLYVAVSDTLLEILSLGSILVAPRTKTLSIQIPLFCCNVSEKDEERRKIIKEMIEGALAALQDLAISPGIQDPTLNTAECVIEGHKMDIDATGRKYYIRTILLLPLFFTIVSCPLLANVLENYGTVPWAKKRKAERRALSARREREARGESVKRDRQDANENEAEQNKSKTWLEKFIRALTEKNKINDNAARAIGYLFVVLAVIGSFILITAYGFSTYMWFKGNARPDILIAQLFTSVSFWGLIIMFRNSKMIFVNVRDDFPVWICAWVTSYFSCWLLIGIMMNPAWGLTVTLLVCFTVAAIGFVVYKISEIVVYDEIREGQSLLAFFLLLFSAIFLVAIVVLAGQPFNGRETANESLKPALLSVIGALISWVSWKRHSSVEQTQLTSSDVPTSDTDSAQSPIQPPPPGDSSAENGQTNAHKMQHCLVTSV